MDRPPPPFLLILLLILHLLPPPAAAAVRPSFIDKILPHLPSPKAIKKAIDIADLLREFKDRFGPPADGEERASTSTPPPPAGAPVPVDIAALLVFNISVGSPARQSIAAIMDITSQLVWAQCGPPARAFRPKSSDTFSLLPCSSRTCQGVLDQPCAAGAGCGYVATYGDATNTTGVLVSDTFTFGETAVPSVVFGCSGATAGDFSGASGVVGFGRGPLSLVSQLNLSSFSYFLAPDGHGTSFIQLGAGGASQMKRGRSTPLLRSSRYPDRYYVKLTGIHVDSELLKGIPAGTFDLRANGSGGVFLSTTTPVTFLDVAAYAAVRRAITSSIQSKPVNGSAQGVGPLCYAMDVKVPRLTLVFDGKDAAMELTPANYFFPDDTTGLQCLTILPSSGWSVLGSLVQTGRTMVYDLDGQRLTFETAGGGGDGQQLAADATALQVWTMRVIASSLLLWVLLFQLL